MHLLLVHLALEQVYLPWTVLHRLVLLLLVLLVYRLLHLLVLQQVLLPGRYFSHLPQTRLGVALEEVGQAPPLNPRHRGEISILKD